MDAESQHLQELKIRIEGLKNLLIVLRESKASEIDRRNKLIAELCDALATTTDLLKGHGHYVKHGTDLIQRAREAVKND